MEFLNPGFLYALAALAIPIIIHLFNFRRFKKIAFTNVRFLREIKQKTQNQNRLKHLLVLLMRLLAFLFLVLAFAQPYIPTDDNAEKNAEKMVSVFVDNSFSMEGESEAGVMLEVAKNRAIDIADVYSSTDRFQVLTHDFEGKHQHFVARSEFVNAVQEIELSPQSQNLEQILNRQSDLLGRESQNKLKQSFIVSDFQKSRFDFSSVKPDTTSSISLVHLDRNSPNNIYIDSVWFPTPIRKIGASDAVNIRIANNGNEPVENVSLKLEINGKQKAIGSFGAAANATVDTSLTFIHEEPGIQRMEISLNDFPITYDDTYFLSYNVY
ncbi:MAG: BatA domain-containing protein, partial [Flavobacteriales bacterium]|nr:BatA domain-containing protein [Flavobacteriales bacterium]